MSTDVKQATSATWKVAGNRAAVIKAWQAAGGSVTAWVNADPKPTFVGTDGNTYKAPSYQTIVKWDEYQAVAGGGSVTSKAAAPAVLNVASILAESKRQLTEGRKELEKRKAALLTEIGGIDSEISKVDEALAKLG
jgi:hypothetical protein